MLRATVCFLLTPLYVSFFRCFCWEEAAASYCFLLTTLDVLICPLLLSGRNLQLMNATELLHSLYGADLGTVALQLTHFSLCLSRICCLTCQKTWATRVLMDFFFVFLSFSTILPLSIPIF